MWIIHAHFCHYCMFLEHCMKIYCSVMFSHVFFYGMQLKSGLEQEEARQDWQPKLAENGPFWACSFWAVDVSWKWTQILNFWIRKKKGWSQCQNSGSLFGCLCNVLLFSRKGSRPFQTTKFVILVGAYEDKKVRKIYNVFDEKNPNLVVFLCMRPSTITLKPLLWTE